EVQARTKEVTESLEYQTATSEVLSVISKSPSELQPVLDSITEIAQRLCVAERVTLWRLRDDTFELAASNDHTYHGTEFVQQNPPLAGRRSLAGRTVLAKRTLHIADALRDAETPPEALARIRIVGSRTMLCVPLLREGEPIGVFILGRSEVRPFTERQVSLVETFADQAVIAIENARLFEAEQARTKELAESLRQQTATADVLKAISRSVFDLQPVLDTLVRSAAKLCSADHALIRQRTGENYYVTATEGFSPEQVAHYKSYSPRPVQGSIFGRAVLNKRTEHVPDILADPQFERSASRLIGLRAVAVVPLLRDGDVIGVFSLMRVAPRPFTATEIALIETFADQAVIAIENARLLEELQTRQRELTESLEYQTAISDVLGVISRSPNELKPVLDTIVGTAQRLCEGDRAQIFMEREGRFEITAHSDTDPHIVAHFVANPIVPSRATATARAALEGRTVHVPDVTADPEYDPQGFHSLLGGSRLVVPLRRAGKTMGLIAIPRRIAKPFTERQIALVTTFADQAVIAVNNVGLFEQVQARTKELTESLEYQTAISEVLGVIARSPTDMQPVFDTIAENAARLCGAMWSTVNSFDGELISLRAMHNLTNPAAITEVQRVFPRRPVSGGLVDQAILARDVVYLPDFAEAHDFPFPVALDVTEMRSMLAVPLLNASRPVGAISVAGAAPNAFSKHHAELLKAFADQAVIALNNIELFEQVQARTKELQERSNELSRSLDELRSLSDVGRVVSSSLDMREVLETVLKNACRMTYTSGGTVYVYDKASGTFRVEAGYNMSEEHIERVRSHPMRIGDALVGECAQRREAVQISDLSTEDRTRTPLFDILARAGVRAILAVPLIHQGEVVGALVVRRNVPGAFSPELVRLLETFAAQSAIAVNNARLFEEVQARTREVQESLEFQTAANEVLKIISRSAFDLEPVLQSALDTAVRLCKADMGSIFQLDGTSYRWSVGTGLPSDDEAFERQNRISVDRRTLVGRAALAREAVHIQDAWSDPEYGEDDEARMGNIRSMLGVPLLRNGHPIGVFALARARLEPFTPRQIDLVTTFADQSVIAIENIRLFNEIRDKSTQLEQASQHKSQFLANMSHELRTPLNAILGYTELMQDGIYGDLPEKASGVLGRVQSNGKHLLGLINQVLDLSKIEAGQFTLNLSEYSVSSIVETVVAATESLATEKKLAQKADVAREMPRGIGDEQRIVQVLLNLVGNAIKFTDRGEVRILAGAFAGRFEIAVVDTGPGIAPEEIGRIFEEFHQVDSSNTKVKGGTGLGLAIAKSIVEMHGGRISVESTVGRGSTFKVELPVRVEQGRRAEAAQ
ncbi:MAG TPA: GAF domain-containing protein, partial [Hyphomicrobiaceae bacterium]|nr:GAF domain-containing protein [Hyphomicrobiaceae bacterium]